MLCSGDEQVVLPMEYQPGRRACEGEARHGRVRHDVAWLLQRPADHIEEDALAAAQRRLPREVPQRSASAHVLTHSLTTNTHSLSLSLSCLSLLLCFLLFYSNCSAVESSVLVVFDVYVYVCELCRMLVHPSVFLLHGVCITNSDLYSVCEFVQGVPLYGYLRNKAISDGTCISSSLLSVLFRMRSDG
jgi:hypothetical protein